MASRLAPRVHPPRVHHPHPQEDIHAARARFQKRGPVRHTMLSPAVYILRRPAQHMTHLMYAGPTHALHTPAAPTPAMGHPLNTSCTHLFERGPGRCFLEILVAPAADGQGRLAGAVKPHALVRLLHQRRLLRSQRPTNGGGGGEEGGGEACGGWLVAGDTGAACRAGPPHNLSQLVASPG